MEFLRSFLGRLLRENQWGHHEMSVVSQATTPLTLAQHLDYYIF